MKQQVVDLFDDPPWPTEIPARLPGSYFPRRSLLVSLVLVLLFMASMLLPWFTSGETPEWTPFQHQLDHGWATGTRDWGFLVLAVAVVAAIAIGIAIRKPRVPRMITGLLAVAALVVVTFLEASAHLSIDPGPDLHADYGAWIGAALAVLTWTGLAIASLFAMAERRRLRQR